MWRLVGSPPARAIALPDGTEYRVLVRVLFPQAGGRGEATRSHSALSAPSILPSSGAAFHHATSTPYWLLARPWFAQQFRRSPLRDVASRSAKEELHASMRDLAWKRFVPSFRSPRRLHPDEAVQIALTTTLKSVITLVPSAGRCSFVPSPCSRCHGSIKAPAEGRRPMALD